MVPLLSFSLLLLGLALPQAGEAAQQPAVGSVDQQVATESAAVQAALQAWTGAQLKLHGYESPDGRLQVWSDFPASEAKDAVRRTAAILERLDRALGAPPAPAAARLSGLLLRDPEAYLSLCEMLGAVAPAQAAYLEGARKTTGFTLYAPPITVYFHDAKTQKEARADHSLAHNFVHLELARRFGPLPLWLTEGLACAGEDGAWGEVWAYWNRSGFVAAKSHGEWRGKKTQTLVREWQNLDALFDYSANPFEEDRALLAFAFATYGLDAEPERFGAFVKLLQAAYQANHPQGGRAELPAAEVTRLLHQAFGADFLIRFQEWWKKPPKWNAKRA